MLKRKNNKAPVYPVGLVIKGKYYVLNLDYPGAHIRPHSPWGEYASLVANLKEKVIMLHRRSGDEPRRRSSSLTREERSAFRKAKDITDQHNNPKFFKGL